MRIMKSVRFIVSAACLVAVLALPTPAGATYPGQTGVIAFDPDGITLINPDGTGKHSITDAGSFPAWSADGSKIYFSNGGIWSIRPDGTGLRKVTRPGQWMDVSPWPLPDGSVVFESDRGHPGCCDRDLWRKVPGRKAFRLTATPDSDRLPVASPDGKEIAFLRSSRCQTAGCVSQNLFMMDADGANVRLLARRVEYTSSDWSPDGTLVSFSREVEGPEEGIFLVDVTTGQVRRVGDLLSFEAGWGSIEFAPDGTKLLVVSDSSAGDFLFTVNFDGSDVRYVNLCCDEIYFGRAAWQPT
jgi:Tol biopolymer transport system component